MARQDKLPEPATTVELYLSAILEELRSQKQGAAAPPSVTGYTPDPSDTRVKEPTRRSNR